MVKRRGTLDEVVVVCSSGDEGAPWQAVESAWERAVHTRMWEYFSFQRLIAKRFVKEAEKEQQEGIQGQWQHELPAKEYL